MDSLPTRPTRFRWAVFAVACGTSWMLYLHRYAFALIKPKLSQEMGIEAGELGLLDTAFSICYLVFQIPLGMLTDFFGVRWMLTGMILVWTVALALHAVAPTRDWMIGARALLGAGQSAVFAAIARITRAWFPTSTRSTVQGVVGVFAGRAGGMCSNLLFAVLLIGVLGLDWRTATYIFAANGFLLAIAFFAIYRNSPVEHPAVNEAEAVLIADGDKLAAQRAAEPIRFRDLFRNARPRALLNLFALNIQTILSTIADNIYSNWIPLFLVQVHLLNYKKMGIMSFLPLLGGALGGAVGGWLNDYSIRMTGNPRWARTTVALVGKGLAAAFLFGGLFFAYDNPYVFCSILLFVKFFGDWSLSTTWATVTDIGGRASATVFAFNNGIASLGSLVAPMMFGYVAQYYGWRVVFLIAASTYVACALSWLLVNCTIPLMTDDDAAK